MDKAKKRAKQGRSAGGPRRKGRIVSPELRLKAVKLFLEEGLSQGLICREVGVHKSALDKWVRRYRRGGEDGLKDRPRAKSASAPASSPLKKSPFHAAT